MLGESPVMVRLRREIGLVARSDFSVLITGETGVGKELAALAIHAASGRREQPLLSVNCANLMESLAESELLGHNKGAFTSAGKERTGRQPAQARPPAECRVATFPKGFLSAQKGKRSTAPTGTRNERRSIVSGRNRRENRGGSAWESNPPNGLLTRYTGFEVH